MKRFLLLAAVLVLLPAGCAFAQFSENFDSYANGQVLDGTLDDGGWKGWDNSAGASGTVTNAMSVSPQNSVGIGPNSDLVHEFNVTQGAFSFRAMQYLASGTAGTTWFILLNTYRDGGPDSWSLQLQFNMDTGLIDDGNTAVAENVAIVFDQWMEIRTEVDLAANTENVYYGGNLIVTNAWNQGDPEAHTAFGAVDLYGAGAGNVYYDDISMTMVPEPSSLLALAGFLPALALLRRRK